MSQSPSKTGNERYPTLSKSYDHFCAGDYEQFVEHLCFDPTTGDASEKKYTLHDVLSTFEYMFHKFKKGLFFQIRNNELKTFLPFSKINYQNNWGHLIQIDPMFGKDKNDLFRFRSMLDTINKGTKYENYDINFQRNFEEWYANNGLFRFEYPLQEFDSGYPMLYDMLLCLSKERKLPDTDGFLNKRDFPIVNQDRTEPYYHLFGHGQPIEPKYQKQFDRFLPIWSMNSGDKNLDWKIPTWEDWRFFEYQRHGKVFTEKKNNSKTYPHVNDFHLDFDAKLPVAVFRGSSTGIGVTSKTNQRLFVCELSSKPENQDKRDGQPFLDAKITNFNRRPRKRINDPYIRTIDIQKYKNLLGEELNYVEQSRYKYILHIPGHSCAYRLTIELFFGSVILYFPSETTLWYFDMLEPYVHYIPMKSYDKDCIFSTIQWCKENNDKCREIAKNAREFAFKYMNSEYALDYLQEKCQRLSSEYGIDYAVNKEEKTSQMIMYNQKILASFEDKCLFSLLENYWIENYYLLQIRFRELDMKNQVGQFLTEHCVNPSMIENRNTSISLFHYRGLDFICKKIRTNFRRDDLQQLFVGYHVINRLCQEFPEHFIHTIYHQYDENNQEMQIFLEYKQGRTLFDMLLAKELEFQDMILIWIELCCLLQIAQNYCSFVHNDLMTWNIMIRKLDKPQSIFFEEFNLGFVRQYIPIIIDYGDCHVVYKNQSFYNTIPFHISTLTDVVFLVFKSLENYLSSFTHEIYVKTTNEDMKKKKYDTLLKKQKTIDDIKTILLFFESMIGKKKFMKRYSIAEYNSVTNKMVNDDYWMIKNFLKKRSKYSLLLEKIESFPNKNPIQFIYFLLQNKFLDKKHYFRKIVAKQKYYLRGYLTPFFNFYMRNRILHEIMKDCANIIIMKNEIGRFVKKVEKQTRHYVKLLCEIKSDVSKPKHRVVLLFKTFYDNQFCALADIMKEKFQRQLYLGDVVHEIQIPPQEVTLETKNCSSSCVLTKKEISPIYFTNYKTLEKSENHNLIQLFLIQNCFSLQEYHLFDMRL